MILKSPWRGRWKAAEPEEEEEEEEEEANWRTGEEPEVWKKRWIVWETVQRCVISGRPGGREGGIEGNKCSAAARLEDRGRKSLEQQENTALFSADGFYASSPN